MPNELGQETGDQATANAQSSAASAPANGDQARLNGALQKIQSLTEENRTLSGTIVQLQGEISKLHGDHAGEKAMLASTAGETSTKLTAATAQVAALQAELNTKNGTLLKLKLIKANGMNNLLDIMEDIPVAADEASQLEVLKRFQGFAAKVGTAREADLVAGVVPTILSSASTIIPKDSKQWTAHIESLPLGSPERQSAWDAYYAAVFKQK